MSLYQWTPEGFLVVTKAKIVDAGGNVYGYATTPAGVRRVRRKYKIGPFFLRAVKSFGPPMASIPWYDIDSMTMGEI